MRLPSRYTTSSRKKVDASARLGVFKRLDLTILLLDGEPAPFARLTNSLLGEATFGAVDDGQPCMYVLEEGGQEEGRVLIGREPAKLLPYCCAVLGDLAAKNCTLNQPLGLSERWLMNFRPSKACTLCIHSYIQPFKLISADYCTAEPTAAKGSLPRTPAHKST